MAPNRQASTRRTDETPPAGKAVASPVEIGPLSGFLGYALRRAQLAVFDDFRRSVGKLGLRPAQFSVLVVISTTPGLKQTEVANSLGIQRTNFVAMVNELERMGLIERRPLDRRSLALHLTPAGEAKLAAAMREHQAMEERYARQLGPGGRDALLELLAALQRDPEQA